ncbi:alpha/beta fold hydrolase [Cryobacterium frigoriphilum]|uniref:Alpha/beta fold hydrolase n=1 Tax=Cryobacterium frigoriphilum TaxID=1259150 RepID=A0A4R9ABF8_9MICO|nr:alpha/beta fold hydrolase [Cryobacterium frigoriphilum]TFD54744.1 alpha/beta fold hydrolase [Cryobacterium frigoriphilum]
MSPHISPAFLTRLTALAAAALLATGLSVATTAAASDTEADVEAGAAASVSVAVTAPAAPTVDGTAISPAGANDWSCVPTAEHPYPVVLVPGTFETSVKNWSTLSPVLKDAGYCVYALDYGEANGIAASGPIRESAAELATFVNEVREASGAAQVDLVGHSQGGMMPRYYMGFLGGAAAVHSLVGIAPSNHGTEGVLTPTPDQVPADMGGLEPVCAACSDQAAGSEFLTELNSIGDLVAVQSGGGPFYTVISTVNDEVVTPYQSQFLAGPAERVTNITIQDLCPLDPIEHDQAPNDPVVHQLVLNALVQPAGPADPAFQPACL